MKKLTICLSIFSFLFLLTSCSNTYTYKEDGPFITAYMAPVGPGIPEDLITEHITIYQNSAYIFLTVIMIEGKINQSYNFH